MKEVKIGHKCRRCKSELNMIPLQVCRTVKNQNYVILKCPRCSTKNCLYIDEGMAKEIKVKI